MSCHWSCDPRWVKISGHSEQLEPCWSASYFVNNRHSRVKTRAASCIGGFGQTDGRRKFELGIPQSRGAPYIRGASYIRDKTVSFYIWLYAWMNATENDSDDFHNNIYMNITVFFFWLSYDWPLLLSPLYCVQVCPLLLVSMCQQHCQAITYLQAILVWHMGSHSLSVFSAHADCARFPCG